MKTVLDELKDSKIGTIATLANGKTYYIFDDYDNNFEFAKLDNVDFDSISKTIEKINVNDNFVSIWRTSINNETITLPLVEYGEYDFTVEWGDGNIDKITEYNQDAVTHTYLQPNDYTVRIYGIIKGFNFNDSFSISSNKLIAILNWGVLELINSEKSNDNGIFKGCVNLELIKSLSELKSDTLTNANSMFENCNNLKDITGLIQFRKFHKVRNFENMFKDVTLSTNVYDIFLTHLNNSFLPIETSEKLNIDFGNSKYEHSEEIRNDLNVRFNINDGGKIVNATILTFKTTTSNEPIKLPLEETGNYNFIVDWGDNTSDTITSYDQTEVEHIYANAGTYDINITGTLEGFNFYNGHSDSKTKIIDIKQWGNLKLKTINHGSDGNYFYECSNLETFSAEDAPDLSEVNSLEWMFYICSKFNGNINHWDVSKVIDMHGMFWSASIFNQPLNNWNVSNVTNMRNMFYDASRFNQSLNNWNVSNVTKMYYMFYGASSFNQPLDNWDVSNVTNMTYMFAYTSSFNQPLDNWNVSNVTKMYYMFWLASRFNQPLDNWNVSNVIDMQFMFKDASSFNQPLNNWDVSKVTDMRGMFENASSFNQPLDNWDVSNVTNMRYMFEYISSFNQPLDNWNVSNVTDMNRMFKNASSFNQPLNNWDVSNVTVMYGMFESASSFNEDIHNWDVNNVTNWAKFKYNCPLTDAYTPAKFL